MATSSSAEELSQLPPCICGRPIKEEVSVNPDKPNIVTWSQKHTDFALVLKSGQELKCHKHVLAESSTFFDTMLSQQQFAETVTARMKVEHLEEETVYSFLEYLYSNKVGDEDTIRALVGPDHYIYKRSFPNKAKLTLDLMKVAHMYEVKDLMKDCSEHLRSTLCDHNVMERFLQADKLQVSRLKHGALKFLLERTGKIPINHIPGFKTAFDSNHKHLRDLLLCVSAQRNVVKAQLDKANAKLSARDKEVAELKGKLAKEKKKIAVKVDLVSWTPEPFPELICSELFNCKVTDTVQSLVDRMANMLQDDIAGLSLDDNPSSKNDLLDNNKRLEEHGIVRNTTLYAFNSDEM